MDALTTAQAVRDRTTTAVETVAAALERAAATDHLNAFTQITAERALERASLLDRQIEAGADPGPLAGVPIALKDLVDQEGLVTTAGSSFLRDPAREDAEVVVRLERAGAIIIGRTGLHEFAYGFSSENDWWGPVRNPWDPTTSPGGSSGGSAVAVASGVTPIGIGTDTGGSVRVPAALCGLVGLKVTHGRVSLRGVFPLAASLDTVGPLTRTVRDAALAYGVIAGFDPADPWSRQRTLSPIGEHPIDTLRIGIPHPWVDRPLSDEQASGFTTLRRELAEAGATVVELEAPNLDPRDLARHPGAYHEVADVHRDSYAADPTRYGAAIRTRIREVFDLTAADIDAGTRWRQRVRTGFDTAFTDCDLILTPATAARRKPLGIDLLDVGAGPEPYRTVLSWFTPLVNQAGIPAITIPVDDPAVDGLPPAVQLIGPAWSESVLLGAALALEERGVVAHRSPDGQT